MKKIQTAIIGYGLSGKFFHVPPLINHEFYNIKYILTKNSNSIEELNQNYPSIKIISSLEEALNDQEIDLVIIATSNDVHGLYTRKAILAGKHVLVEKPFIETHAEAKELFELAHKHHVLLRVFHNRIYDGDVITMQKLLKEVDFGRIISFTARFDRYVPHIQENWRYKEGIMVGIYYDLAPHLIYDALEFFGYPESVYLERYKTREHATVDDQFEMKLYYKHMTVNLGSEVMMREEKPRFEIVGTRKTYVKYGFDIPDQVYYPTTNLYQDSKLKSVIIDETLNQNDVPLHLGAHYLFFEQLQKDIFNQPEKDLIEEKALAVILIMEKGLLSEQEKRVVKIV